ncbi:c-type cytochrome [Aurantiacibacter aquimixticola]|uniref:Cytochrome c family protein n=1 Tax=Aurantiacibacter aquimixticola TaxID=1958945 RepID=A0A419RX70_9SPHN|nr:c-type cytochrome [Aurantiacibacter aquimixticola]RJY10396.1 cytochrome c family protein [Aurantiacibacter aquimixticola]
MRLWLSSLIPITALLAGCEAEEQTAGGEERATAEVGAPAPDNTRTLDGTTFAQFTPDAAHGEQLYRQCQSCHALEPGVNRSGPTLAGIVGASAGAVDGYNYTPANANAGIVWSREKLFQYLEDPDRIIPGTKMAYPGMPAGQDRADLIAFLAEQ